MSDLFRRLYYLIHWRSRRQELADEMDFHREMAAAQGRSNFGRSLRLREESRDAWGWTWIDRLGQDLRYASRVMARTPGFTVVAVLILAIGIGVNIAAFSLFNMVALKPLPVPQPDRLVRLERRSFEAYTSEMSYPSFTFYRDHAHTLSAAMGIMGTPAMQIDDDLQGTPTSFVTSNYFAELATRPAYGRLFDSEIDKAEAAPSAVITYGLWQRRFAGNPSIIGRTVRLNKKPATIIGVLPLELATLGGEPDIWLPISQQPYFVDGSHALTSFEEGGVHMWGRLAPGISAPTAVEELRRLTDELRRQHPSAVWDKEYLQISAGGHLQVMQPAMYTVAAAIAVLTLLILAVACANLGALLLARAVQRTREIGIRFAIGANRSRIFRQLATESLLLASMGAVAGLALGSVVVQIALAELDAPKWLSAVPDYRVVLFTVLVTFFSALLFGFTPALQMARQGRHKTTARQILIGAQVAGSCVLLIIAGLLVRATEHALHTDPGFGYERLVSIDPQLGQHGYSAAQASVYLDRLQERLLATPGVRSVGLVEFPPLGHIVSRSDVTVDGRKIIVYPNNVSANFFDAMQIPLRLGRTFYPHEKNVMIVSESFARGMWPNKNPLGQQVGSGAQKDTVVGVVGDAHINALSDDDASEEYWPAADKDLSGMTLVARTAGSLETLPGLARSISESLDPKLLPEVNTIRALYSHNTDRIEQVAAAVSLIGVVALVLAVVGIVGVATFTVRQRTKEIAIRLALGARPGTIIQTLVTAFVWPTLIGLVAGIAFTAAASGILRRFLFGISNLDLASYAAAVGFLVAMLAIAAVAPARRALRINVSKALHYE